VAIAALVISILALLVSGLAVFFAARQTREARRQADAAQKQLHRADTPVLTVTLRDEPRDGPDLLYEVRNDGHQDLDSVVVQRPETPDRVRYPVARLGGDYGDEAELGPLAMGAAQGFLLRVGPTQMPPEFRVRISCRVGAETWPLSRLLEPRPPGPQIF